MFGHVVAAANAPNAQEALAPLASQYGTTIAIFVLAFLQQWNDYRAKKRQEEVVLKAAQVAESLKASDALKAQKIMEIHSLVNSDMGLQLKKVMLLTQQISDSLSTSGDNVAYQTAKMAALSAKIDYEAHMEKQKTVDASKEAFEAGQKKAQADAALQQLNQESP